ncbi:D-alanyl-D-alanine carboxypeptidase / D-alanyl-D-alanine-endopeptidase (penicillin-binding protein 4) [Salegentibacter echinorum]|uniref:D-alanyl-D-alanine carboxypeptidase / D-alanyl-D-alanine-endopeptidase (Penicillin-binding protein 4) n=1 Tax=Salegentibacter echinorum TaxID=1073325 RepID=A0A1M5GPQ3_SALEC|nr:D-alanyl-D-alanine carboxypeptidase/D-alanyl-D-alanine-endopeptidase [Salegentibacter echinorum]SHG05724.1 D-alanyl-D-alanine carboxypeptidase / D-alanyl-D-alanine-endopeptidase (penicillin-binding protein 4) [Salegentibacter echinorum]
MKCLHLFRNLLKFSLFLCLIFILNACAANRKIKKPLDDIFENSLVFKKGFVGFKLIDPAEEKVLYRHNAHKYFTPASNTKLFTFYAGLKMLGDSVPALHYIKQNDTLFFKATGDPSFLNDELPESQVYKFLKDSQEQLAYVPPYFTEKHLGPGWGWDDYNAYYSAERSAFPIYGNLAHFQFQKNKEFPTVTPRIFQDSIAVSMQRKDGSGLKRALEKNRFDFNNKNKGASFSQNIPLKFSSETFINLLADTLKKPVALLEDPEKAKELTQTLYSIPADSIYKKMLKVSDNFIAEQILLLAAQKTSDTLKSQIAIDYMKEFYLKDLPDEPMWYDGSGLSRYNLFTPASIVKLLEKIKEEVPEEKLLDMLPAGGHSGTIKNYYKADKPYVFAKTGTLKNNHSLSGYLKTKSGKLLIFSFMNSNYTVPTKVLKAEMEQVLLNIRDNY